MHNRMSWHGRNWPTGIWSDINALGKYTEWHCTTQPLLKLWRVALEEPYRQETSNILLGKLSPLVKAVEADKELSRINTEGIKTKN